MKNCPSKILVIFLSAKEAFFHYPYGRFLKKFFDFSSFFLSALGSFDEFLENLRK